MTPKRIEHIPLWNILKKLPSKKALVTLNALSRIQDLVTPVLFGTLISMLSLGIRDGRIYAGLFGIGITSLLSLATSWAYQRLETRAFSTQERLLKESVWNSLQTKPELFRNSPSPGVWMQIIGRDIPVVQSTCRMVLDASIRFSIFIFGTFLLVAWKSPRLTIIFFSMIAGAIVSHSILNRQIKEETRQLRESIYAEGDVIHNLLKMLPVLSSFSVTALFKPLFVESVSKSAELQSRQNQRMMNFQTLLLLEVLSVRTLTLIVCTFQFVKQDMAVGDIVMYDMLVAQMLGSLSQFMFTLPQMEIGTEYAISLQNTIFYKDEAAPPLPHPPPHKLTADSAAFTIKKMTFQYHPESPPIISNFSTKISSGEFVCFFGRNGAGKSTLAKLLSGTFPPNSGTISSSGDRPIVVPQSIDIYHDTLLENIRLRDQKISASQVRAALNLCGMQLLLASRPNGLYSLLSPGGCSGGELRAIGIARALVRNPKTLILDEITENLDVVAKESVCAMLNGLRGQCTIILITHDSSYIRLADRVFVFHRNGISEAEGLDPTERASEAMKIIREST